MARGALQIEQRRLPRVTRMSVPSDRREPKDITYPYLIISILHYFSVVMRHPSHIVRWFRVPPQRSHLRIIGGGKIADGDAHRSVAQKLPGGIVVRCGNFQDIAARKFVAAILDKQFHGHGLKMSLSVRLRIE